MSDKVNQNPDNFQGMEWPSIEKIIRAALGLRGLIAADVAVYPTYSDTEREEQALVGHDAQVKVAALEVMVDAHPWLLEIVQK